MPRDGSLSQKTHGSNRERPILFSGPMVRAIMEGRKTQTRRVICPGDAVPVPGVGDLSPYGVRGGKLWVRETFRVVGACDSTSTGGTERWAEVEYAAVPGIYRRIDVPGPCPLVVSMKWRPSIFMPRWASRITLHVTSVRAERLMCISPSDAMAEGIDLGGWAGIEHDAREGISVVDLFRELWDSINAKRGYGFTTDPWVWVVTFEVAKDAARAA